MSIAVWIEQTNGKAYPSCWEAVGKAREIGDALSKPVYAIVLGKGAGDVAKEAISYGADKVFVGEDATLETFRMEPYAAVVEKIVKDEGVELFMAIATRRGRDITAAVAADLGAGIAPDATDMKLDGEKVVVTRPTFTGNILADIEFNSDVKVDFERSPALTLERRDFAVTRLSPTHDESTGIHLHFKAARGLPRPCRR